MIIKNEKELMILKMSKDELAIIVSALQEVNAVISSEDMLARTGYDYDCVDAVVKEISSGAREVGIGQ